MVRVNNVTKADIIKTIKYNTSKKDATSSIAFLESLLDTIQEMDINLILNKLKELLHKLITVYPTIILNNLDTKVTLDSFPKPWKAIS